MVIFTLPVESPVYAVPSLALLLIALVKLLHALLVASVSESSSLLRGNLSLLAL